MSYGRSHGRPVGALGGAEVAEKERRKEQEEKVSAAYKEAIALYKNKVHINSEYKKILSLNSFPIWLIFTSFSFFRQTLPHWTGPAFTPLLILAAVYLSDKTEKLSLTKNKIIFPNIIRSSVYLLCSLLFLAWLLINYYPGTIGNTETKAKYGDTDFTLDMYGWKQVKQ